MTKKKWIILIVSIIVVLGIAAAFILPKLHLGEEEQLHLGEEEQLHLGEEEQIYSGEEKMCCGSCDDCGYSSDPDFCNLCNCAIFPESECR